MIIIYFPAKHSVTAHAICLLVVRMQVPEYRKVHRGMRVAVVVLSRSSGFYELTGITEAYLPELDLFVGRFPLLDKR